MTRKRRRLWIVLACGVGLGSAAALTLSAFSDNLVFFVSPSDLAKRAQEGRSVRLGGLVTAGSVHRETRNGQPVATFDVTDGRATVQVRYAGILPDLFREGQGVVVLGAMQSGGTFRAADVLARHDENYMPKEVADAQEVGSLEPGRRSPSAGRKVGYYGRQTHGRVIHPDCCLPAAFAWDPVRKIDELKFHATEPQAMR